MSSPQKYGIVRAIAFVLKLLAWVCLAGGLLVAVISLLSGGQGLAQIMRPIGLLVGPLVGIVWFVQLYAFGSVLSLLIDIEENTQALANQTAVSAAPVDLA